LEALKLYGKDWQKITTHIGNREIKSVISHGQKFLVRLIEFLEKKKSNMFELTQEEAQYYHGILSKRRNRSTLEMERRLQETQKLREKGYIFRVSKAKKRTQKVKVEGEDSKDSRDDSLSSYEKWKREVLGEDEGSFRGSLGHSVKIAPSSHCTSKRMSFKSKFVVA